MIHQYRIPKCFYTTIVLVVFLSAALKAGTFSNNNFTITGTGSAESNIIKNNGLGLDIERYSMIKVSGDSIPGAVHKSFSSDIIAGPSDSFSFFWVDTLGRRIKRNSFRLISNSVQVENSVTNLCDVNAPSNCYLHSDKGDNDFLVSFIQSSNNKYILTLHNSVTSVDLDTSNTMRWLFSNQCHMVGDTFLIIYSIDVSEVRLVKVYSRGSSLKAISSTQIAAGSAAVGNYLLNCAVGCDTNGNILTLWTKGTPNSDKYLYYCFYDRNLAAGSGGSFAEKIGDNTFHNYDDAQTSSFASGKFAVAYWDVSGIIMYTITLSGGTVQKQFNRVIDKSGVRYCALSSNSQTLLLVYKGDIDGNGYNEIEGKRYLINNGVLSTPQDFIFATNTDQSGNITDSYTTLNCCLDSMGSIGVTWSDGATMAKGCLLANRGIRYKNGYWTSPVDSMDIEAGDSVRFYPAGITSSNLTSWNVEDSIRTGCTVAECLSSTWTSLQNDTALNMKRSGCRYFQYKINIIRKAGMDSLVTPKISSISFDWNTRPVILSIDSIRTMNAVHNNLHIGDTVDILSRIDTIYAFASLRDRETGQKVAFYSTWPRSDSVSIASSGAADHISIKLLPVNYSDSVVDCSFYSRDAGGWISDYYNLKIRTKNSVPILNSSAVMYNSVSDKFDTLKIPLMKHFEIQENDSIEFLFSVRDTNDPLVKAYIYYEKNGTLSKVDSALSVDKKIVLHGSSFNPSDSIKIRISAQDPDTEIAYNCGLIVNHFPHIDSVLVDKRKTVEGDTVKVVIGKSSAVSVFVSDPDLAFWDTAFCTYSTKKNSGSLKSVASRIDFNFAPAINDTMMTIVVNDRYGKKDSVHLYFKFPWLNTDSISNPIFAKIKDSLNSTPSLIAGGKAGDSITLKFKNTGNDTMSITGISFKKESADWLKAGVPQVNGNIIISSDSSNIQPVQLIPDSSISITFYFSAMNLSGDSVIYDTVIVQTNDPAHLYDTIPVRLEYNDLPTLLDIAPSFAPDIPYVPRLSKLRQSSYRFPPHASIQISFSEPIDSVSALKGIQVYSVFDSAVTGKVSPVPLSYNWSQRYTRLDVTPEYSANSPYFKIKPLNGLFIPTDSISVKLTTDITDKARTPSGPNHFDVNRDFVRDSASDTIVNLRVDSIRFSVTSILPRPGDTLVGVKPTIVINFSSPVYGRSVDTSLKNNRSIIIRSLYNGGERLDFDSVFVNGSKVSYRIAKILTYNDSLWCRFRDNTITDGLGFPSDNDNNGIPSPLYDTASTVDDVYWSYRVKPIKITSVSPDSGKNSPEVSPVVSLSFSDPVHPGMFDTDTSTKNRSFQMSTLYSGGKLTFKKIEFSKDSMKITMYPKVYLFSNDTIECTFRGFTRNYRYNLNVNLPDSPNVYGAFTWKFSSGNTGFYTYPNPYKPGSDPRHCRDNGPCGIWFKNLHVLKTGLLSVKIRIYNMNAVPVFDSEKAGENITFSIGDPDHKPQWLWNTENQQGKLVGSGIYFYTIYDTNGRLLMKDKLVIVR
jgi:hypothetical protein